MSGEIIRLGWFTAACLLLASCGTVVPNFEEPWQHRDSEVLLVQELERSIHCEVRRAVVTLMEDDRLGAAANGLPRSLTWLDSWGVQTSLQMTVEERSTIAPGVTLPHNMGDAIRFRNSTRVVTAESRTLAFGGSLAAIATRIAKVYSFYTVQELMQDPLRCRDLLRDPTRSLLLQDDLGLRNWIAGFNLSMSTRDIKIIPKPKPPFNENAITYQVKFQVVSSGNVTPSWKLVTISANPSGPFFETKRDRTHDLIVTLGPTTPDPNGGPRPVLALTAASAANNADIATSIANAVHSAVGN